MNLPEFAAGAAKPVLTRQNNQPRSGTRPCDSEPGNVQPERHGLNDLPQDHHIFRVNACYGIQWNEDLHATGLIAKEEASEAAAFPVTLEPRAATAAAVSQWPANQHPANQDSPRALEAVAAVPSICCLLMCDEALVAEVDTATQGLL